MLPIHIKNVKRLIELYQGSADRAAPRGPQPNPKTYEHNISWVTALRGLADYLIEQERLSTPIPKSLGDLSDIPDELLKELSVKRVDELEGQILTVMRACKGQANLDQVLLGLYRNFKVVQTRRYVQNKLYRMSLKELVFSVPGQKAVYSLEPQEKPNAPKQEEARASPRGDLDDEIPF